MILIGTVCGLAAVELESGSVTLPNISSPWTLINHHDNTFTLTLSSSRNKIDIHILNTLEGMRQRYRVFMPIKLRWGESAAYALRDLYNGFRDWQLEQDYIRNIA